jgi:P63C domain
MLSPSKIVDAFGGQSAFAAVLDTRQSTVAYWVRNERIPAKWHGKILAAAAERGIDIGVTDLTVVPNAPDDVVHALPIARYSGPLNIGEEIACYVLSDGRRVISRTSVTSALTGIKGQGDLEGYVKVENLAPYMAAMKVDLDEELVEFTLSNVTHKRVFGVTAEIFLAICRAYQMALSEDAVLTARQREIAIKAGAFLAACATVGLIALIDEATGYQYERAEDALQVKLRAFLEEEMRPWEKTFPDDLWVEFGRLTGWKGAVQHRPKYWGHLVNELIYQYLDADVAVWLKSHAPKPKHGQNYHQWLSGQYGLKKLMEHIWMVIGVASTCDTMVELRYRMAMRYGKQPVQMMMMLDPPGRG